MNILRAIYRYVTNGFFEALEGYAHGTAAFLKTQYIVRAYYCFLLYASMSLYVPWNPTIGPEVETMPVWPVWWLRFFDFEDGFVFIRLFFVATAFLAAVVPQYRIVRILSLIGLVEFHALYMSMLQLDIDWYGFLLLSLFLVFLPDKWNRGEESSGMRKNFLLVFWGAIAINLLTFTMAGIGKWYGGFVQLLSGESHYFEPKAAALHIADRLVVTDATSVLGPWVIEHYLLAWPYFLFLLYLLTMSFLVAFRPKAHRLWGAMLILYHIGNFLVINIPFPAHIFLWGILLLCSPFTPARTTVREMFLSLPLVDLVHKRVTRV